jgi:hypothetical protein
MRRTLKDGVRVAAVVNPFEWRSEWRGGRVKAAAGEKRSRA